MLCKLSLYQCTLSHLMRRFEDWQHSATSNPIASPSRSQSSHSTSSWCFFASAFNGFKGFNRFNGLAEREQQRTQRTHTRSLATSTTAVVCEYGRWEYIHTFSLSSSFPPFSHLCLPSLSSISFSLLCLPSLSPISVSHLCLPSLSPFSSALPTFSMVAKSSLLFPTFFSTGAVKRSRKLVPEREERVTETGLLEVVCVCVCVIVYVCSSRESVVPVASVVTVLLGCV